MRVNFFAPINTLGYGIHSFYTIRAFEARGHEVCLIPPMGQVRLNNPEVSRWLMAKEKFSAKDPSIMIFNEEWLSQFSGTPRIGFPVFEMEKFTPIQLQMMRSCDYLLTPTKWAKQVLRRNGFQNVFVVNEGIEPEIFQYQPTPTGIKGDLFTFVHVGKFEERKGTLQTIRCFFKAIEKKDARLVMHINNPFLKNYAPVAELLESFGFCSTNNGETWRRMGLVVHFILQKINYYGHDAIARLYAGADCGIFPSKAEGWGLPILECLATGVPAIVGNWTGQSEYLEGSGYPESFLIKSPIQQIAQDDQWFRAGDRGYWHVPMNEELVSLIRHAFENARSIRAGDAWRKSVNHFREFTWDNAAAQLESAITQIMNGEALVAPPHTGVGKL